MANDNMYQQDYGVRPTGVLGGWMQGQEDLYVKARRAQLAEEQQKADLAARGDKDQYNRYLKAQMDRWSQQGKDDDVLKVERANEIKEQRMYPVLKALADQGKQALENGDMAGLQDAAQRFEAIKAQMSPQMAGAFNKPSTYTNNGNSVESTYDPGLASAMADNMDRSRGVVNIQQQGMKNEGAQTVQGMKGKTAAEVANIEAATKIRVQEMKGQIAEIAAKVKGAQGMRTLEGIAASLLQKYQADPSPENYELWEFSMKALQAKQAATITPQLQEGGIVNAPNKENSIPPPLKPPGTLKDIREY